MNAREYILGMDIGGTNFRMGLVDSSNRAYHVEVIGTASVYNTPDTALAIANVIKEYCRRNLAGDMPAMVSAGFPSVIDRERRHLYSSTNLPGLDGVDVVDVIEGQLKIPVIIQHDAYYLLSYDIHDHGMRNEGTMLGFYFGTGLGNGMYIGGQAYIGKNGTACEVGHMPAGLSDEPCSCGNSGCIEMFSCGKRFERLVEKHFPKTAIGDVFAKHGAEKVLDDFVRYMAIPIATEVNILDPDAVFVGGGLVQMKDFPKGKLVEYVLRNARKPFPAENLTLLFSRNSPENGIIGAAIEGFRRLREEERIR